MIRYLSMEDILQIHSMIIDETSGAHGVRDYHALLRLVDSPKQAVFGKELYPAHYEKAAVYARGIIMDHPFVDGNKRSGVTAASVFLGDNGFQITTPKGETELFALRIVKEKLEIHEIASWLQKNSRKSKKVA
ncbi:MAG: type II toxin-antitoxin system death-on-curing family toxin [Candidatus Yanofskybacteria bacterium]|nr:type II toxin-antitoxin system death-on-curing family toxin [Candidatus Yanofskybacteria bacterium]